MKLFCILAFAAASLCAAVNPQLKQVNTVYILGMGSGMDQFLANQLTAQGVFQVVADPQQADAIITDKIGEPFESKLKELYAAPSSADNDKNAGDISGTARVSALGRGKGNFFIVDRKTRAVLWSIYQPPTDNSADTLSRTAAKLVKRLKNDLTEKKQSAQ
jgi:hypothetical protein